MPLQLEMQYLQHEKERLESELQLARQEADRAAVGAHGERAAEAARVAELAAMLEEARVGVCAWVWVGGWVWLGAGCMCMPCLLPGLHWHQLYWLPSCSLTCAKCNWA